MKYSAKVLLDSTYEGGTRLTTMQICMPRFILAEFSKHRVFSFNTASSRAIPVSKMLEMVEKYPVIPISWGRNKSGMSASEQLSHDESEAAILCWNAARWSAIRQARSLNDLKVHKQTVNRLLEPFAWTTLICTSTEWDNFFELRTADNAQPEMQHIAKMIQKAYQGSDPKQITKYDWHIPLIQSDEEELDDETRCSIGAARSARVSYLTHDGRRDAQKDLDLFKQLVKDRHFSPLEHVAAPNSKSHQVLEANLKGWMTLRTLYN